MASLDHSHSHDALGGHGHTHEILDGPGSFLNREQPLSLHEGRDWKDRAYTIGIGGLVFCLSLSFKEKNKKQKQKLIRFVIVQSGLGKQR